LISNLKALRYPQNKLDILFLMEEDDNLTIQSAKACKPPGNIRFIYVPESIPRTKPKACNYGLFFATGKYLVIYDAEDLPDQDQLVKALRAFRSRKDFEDNLILQCALNFYNVYQNILTMFFAIEYSHWFDHLLPGLHRLGLVIPLGGTSNHFPVQLLRNIGGWDPYNVTEDADLGVRAAFHGVPVATVLSTTKVNSTTLEEANSRLINWLRQRSRWVKGYMQTVLVYTRNPLKMVQKLGIWRYFCFLLFVGGTPLVFLLNPVLWLLYLLYLFHIGGWEASMFVPWLRIITNYSFLLGNLVIVVLNLIGVLARRYYKLIPIAIISPVYWVLHSIAAYIALYELLVKPHYWYKTKHGLAKYGGTNAAVG